MIPLNDSRMMLVHGDVQAQDDSGIMCWEKCCAGTIGFVVSGTNGFVVPGSKPGRDLRYGWEEEAVMSHSPTTGR